MIVRLTGNNEVHLFLNVVVLLGRQQSAVRKQKGCPSSLQLCFAQLVMVT